MRPIDLARRFGVSAQAIRNYEAAGILPPAERSEFGYRSYDARHAAAMAAFVALVRGFGRGPAGEIMSLATAGRLADALSVVDVGHAQLAQDRRTLRTVEQAARLLPRALEPPGTADPARSIGELASRLRVTSATLRAWERAGILSPSRDRATGHRWFTADDVRDADLAHMLRRGGHSLGDIAVVVRELRGMGDTSRLAAALDAWQARLTAQGLAMLDASGALADYLRLVS